MHVYCEKSTMFPLYYAKNDLIIMQFRIDLYRTASAKSHYLMNWYVNGAPFRIQVFGTVEMKDSSAKCMKVMKFKLSASSVNKSP